MPVKCGQINPNSKFASGFTLIELIVVVCLISTMLFLILPRLENSLFLNNTHKAARWIIGTARILKDDAQRKQKRFKLVFNLDTNRMWVSTEAEQEEKLQSLDHNQYILPSDVKILDVEYPSIGKITSGRADINFYKKGYSDKVLIHLEDDDENQISLLIEPFLSKVAVYEEYIRFEE
ncbi:MAG: type II secretion system protein [Desulfobacterales bacterium]